jgi:electron transfer flavoprotein alpha subunit
MILVLVETDASGATEVSRETLTFARELAGRAAVPLHAVVVGDVSSALASQLGDYGVAVVHRVVDEALSAYAAAAWAAAVVAVASSGASVVTAAGTARGNEVLAHVATRLGVAMAANVVAVEGTEPLVVSRQVVGGAALEEMDLDEPVAVFSVAGHACEAAPSGGGSASVEEVSVQVSSEDLRARVVRTEAGEPDESGSLKSARVVVGAGRGAGSADGFGDLQELVDLLGGAMGVSRVVTSLGWRPHHEQVGQTGSRISPDLYIPCGISGAIQHWAGCSSAKTILAINTDPDAPMVTRAHYAVIGDLHEIVPAVNEELRRRRA